MKELSTHIKEDITISAEQQQRKSPFIGSIRLQKGLTMWEFNMETMKITAAKFETVNAVMNPATKSTGVRKKLIINKGSIYATALNMKNAEKKFKQRLQSILKNKRF